MITHRQCLHSAFQHKRHEAPNKGPHAAAHTSLAKAEEVVDKVAHRIDRARRGDSKLRAAVGLATVVAVPLGVSVAQASVPLQPAQVHADDAWLAAHLGNQSLAMSELDAARQLAASDALVLASYSSKLDLARCFNSADVRTQSELFFFITKRTSFVL